MSSLSALEKARIAAEAGLDRKATDPVILDVRDITSFADAFVVLTGSSDRQVRAIADAVQRALRKHGGPPRVAPPGHSNRCAPRIAAACRACSWSGRAHRMPVRRKPSTNGGLDADRQPWQAVHAPRLQ